MSLSISHPIDSGIPTEVLQDAPWFDGSDKAIITFGMGDNGARGRFSGLPVYGHKDYSQIEIGETWYCALEPNDSKNYFAIPILRIDASTLYSLSPGFRHDLAETMIDQFPEQARALLEESIGCDSQQIDSPEHDNGDDGAKSNEKDAPDNNLSENEKTMIPERSDMIYRSGPNRLTSDLFVGQHYHVCMSRDRSAIRIQANESGNVNCCDNKIEIDGLDILMPSLDSCVLKPRVSKNTGTIWVSVKQKSSENRL